MVVEVTQYHVDRGWSAPLPQSLDSPNTLVVAFGASRFRSFDTPVADIVRSFPASRTVGCSTAGEIAGSAVSDDTLTVAACHFDNVRLESATTRLEKVQDSFFAGVRLARRLDAPGLRALFVLSDGLCTNGSDLLRGLNAVVGPDVVVTGGLAGDGDRFTRTWVLSGAELAAGFVTAVGLYGDAIHVGCGSQGGWDIFGIDRRVTRASGNVLYELDGRPALGLYKSYLGDRASGLPGTALLFPLGILSGSDEEPPLVRTVLAVDERAQSMTFAGDIPQGATVRLMRANRDRLIGGAARAGHLTSNLNFTKTPAFALAVSCVGRRIVLGQRTDEEIEAVYDSLPQNSIMVGFYSYGEFSPLASGRSELHNQTMTVTALWEN